MNDKKINGLSVCIIAKNEENNLKNCLESVHKCADEIILVDTGSTDKTIQIAAKFKCRIVSLPWNDDFSAARNAALDIVEYPFVLTIDADEVLDNPEELSKTLRNADSNAGGWILNVISDVFTKEGAKASKVSSLLRLFKSGANIRFDGIIHEQVLPSIVKAGYKIENSDIIIRHSGYSHSSEDYGNKLKRNLKLLDKAIDNEQDNSYLLFQRALTYFSLSDFIKAEEDIKTAISLHPEMNIAKAQYLNHGAAIAVMLKDVINAKKRLIESLEILPDQIMAKLTLGDLYLQECKYAFALEYYLKVNIDEAISTQENMIVPNALLSPSQYYFNMGKAYLGLKQVNESEINFNKGLYQEPDDINCLTGLANICFIKKDYEQSLGLLNRADKLAGGNPEIKSFIAQVEAALSKTTKQTVPKVKKVQSSEKPLLSLSMIVKNEEKDLPECLDSAKEIVDEIIIVDTGSDDNTIEIAKSYGAKVFQFDWINDFAAARNESLKHCSGEWILYLDADERLNDNNKYAIRDLLNNADQVIGAFIVTLESEHSQLNGGTEMHRGGYPRIFRNYGYPNISFRGRVHEQITPSIFALNRKIDFSEITITHLGYNQPREIMEQKIQRNYKMLMEHIQEEPLNGYAWYQLGQTLAQMRLKDEAEKAIRFAIESGNLSDSVLASATATLSQLIGNQKKFEEALYWAEKSLEIAPQQIYALNLKAYSLLYLERFSEAAPLFEEVLNRKNKNKSVPRSGFDIDIPEQVILKGLNAARNKTCKLGE